MPRPRGRPKPALTVPTVTVRLEVDLRHELVEPGRLPLLSSLEGLFSERLVADRRSLLELTAGLLSALAAGGFTRVDHWEVEPGGWLPLPEPTHAGEIEPVGHFLRALASAEWRRLATARSFSVRLSGRGRADAVVRRVHRERTHSITLELTGPGGRREARALVARLREHLPVLRVQVEEGHR